VSLLAQINEPEYIFAMYPGKKTDLVQSTGFELVVELLFGKSHRFAVNYVLEGIDRFVKDLVVVQS
jgi:hypothetical protein